MALMRKKHPHHAQAVGSNAPAKDAAQARTSSAQAGVTAPSQNTLSRMRIFKDAKNMIQLNYSASLATPNLGASNIFTFTPKNIGLIKRIFVEAIVTGTTVASQTLTLSTFGPANIFSNITFIDYQNQWRINTTGWHLIAVNTLRTALQQGSSSPLAAAQTSDTPLGYTNVLAPISAPATVAASTPWTIKMVFEVPICYADNDFRGAIYMATTGANTTLNMTLNPSFFVAAGSDQTNAVFSYTGAAPTITNVTLNFYQNYLDQLPLGSDGKVILPANDINTIYQLQYTNISGFTANNQLGVPYANLRSFQSTILVYDNGGTLNAGTDITSFGLQAANNTFLWQFDTQLCSYLTRKIINCDMPKGMYYFDHRKDPISTDQFGNTQFVFIPNLVNSNAVLYVAYEFFASRQTIMQSEGLPSG